ncbi:MAG: hypothetical protein MI742_07310 [Desulfobacterales bacterium]|nr:hypothetical protein [Desulfobacterales bacterium]
MIGKPRSRGLEQLMAPERIRNHWGEASRSEQGVTPEVEVREPLGMEACLDELKSLIGQFWKGERAEVLLGMHGKLASLSKEEASSERNEAMGEMLHRMETLMEAYGM